MGLGIDGPFEILFLLLVHKETYLEWVENIYNAQEYLYLNVNILKRELLDIADAKNRFV